MSTIHPALRLAAVIVPLSVLTTGLADDGFRFDDRSDSSADNSILEPVPFTDRFEKIETSLISNPQNEAPVEEASNTPTFLPKMVVVTPQLPTFGKSESAVQKFFRTGTIAEHVGKKMTIKLWASGANGLMITIKK